VQLLDRAEINPGVSIPLLATAGVDYPILAARLREIPATYAREGVNNLTEVFEAGLGRWIAQQDVTGIYGLKEQLNTYKVPREVQQRAAQKALPLQSDA